MPPLETVALTKILSWVWETYGKDITDKTLKKAWDVVRWENSARRYGEKVQRLYGTTRVLGRPNPIPLDGIYTAVNLLDKPTAWQRYTLQALQEEFAKFGRDHFRTRDSKDCHDGLKLVRQGANLYILGKPGAGKTTFLQHVALKSISGDLERVPIFVGLRDLSDSGLSVFDFVVQEFEICDFPNAAEYVKRLLKSGKAILLFDGLDEVNVADDKRKQLITDVENFTRKYDQCQRLITCRLAADNYSFRGDYSIVEMADFSDKQIRDFVSKWFSSVGGEQKSQQFLSELGKPRSQGLRELASVPLLLAMLCLAFEETNKLSSRRAELYRDALSALLKMWDDNRSIRRDEVYRDLSSRRKKQMLSRVAADTFSDSQYFIRQQDLARRFEDFLSAVPNPPAEADGEDILQAIVAQHGLFVERSHGIFSFAHLTFQEYFAARYIAENQAGELPRLIDHADDPRYREVFLLTAAQLPDATAFFNTLSERLTADVQRNTAVVALLRQARKAATAMGSQVEIGAAQSLYLYIALDHCRAFDRTIEHAGDSSDLERDLRYSKNAAVALDRTYPNHALDRTLSLTLVLARSFDRTLDLEQALAKDRAYSLNLSRDNRARKSARQRTRALASSPYSELARDLAIMDCRLYIELLKTGPRRLKRQDWLTIVGDYAAVASEQSAKIGDRVAENRLSSLVARLSGPTFEASVDQLQGLDDDLNAVLKARGLLFPRLNRQDQDTLTRYLAGNALLLDCLEQSVVSDRKAIEAKLLLVPDA